MRAPSRATIASASRSMRRQSMRRIGRPGTLPQGLTAEKNVGGHVLTAGQCEILVDHLDAECPRVAWVENRAALVVEPDFAGVGSVGTGNTFHQRRFAGAVVADD